MRVYYGITMLLAVEVYPEASEQAIIIIYDKLGMIEVEVEELLCHSIVAGGERYSSF